MTALHTPTEWTDRLLADGEFTLAARHWHGGLRAVVAHPDGTETVTGVTVADGAPSAVVPPPGDGVVELRAEPDCWELVTAAVPPPFANDVAAAASLGLRRRSNELVWWQYQPAVQRAVELLRAPTAETPAVERRGASPVGRYVRVELPDGDDGPTEHRMYVEEAGTGIPVLCQHTAGSHGTQWRHVLESDLTDRFRFIAYDLPFHGKSVPPVGPRWWERRYRLEGAFLRSVPLAVAEALDLVDPVFMGCSVGGLLALDLAHHHPDRFRAVISLEGALRIGGDAERLVGLWHPQVSNETKARLMEGLCAPTSPASFRKETIQTYAAGWPPVFMGDLWYYMNEFDLTDDAGGIDTSACGVHILSGEYDFSGTVEHGLAAHRAIPGSTHTVMEGLGHFPMSEHPEAFLPHLAATLERIVAAP